MGRKKKTIWNHIKIPSQKDSVCPEPRSTAPEAPLGAASAAVWAHPGSPSDLPTTFVPAVLPSFSRSCSTAFFLQDEAPCCRVCAIWMGSRMHLAKEEKGTKWELEARLCSPLCTPEMSMGPDDGEQHPPCVCRVERATLERCLQSRLA